MSLPRSGRLNEVYPSRRDAQGNPLCRYCGAPLSGRRTSWCGEDCVREAKIRLWPSAARYYVWERDHGVCALCGFDAGLLERVNRHLEHATDNEYGSDLQSYMALREARVVLARVAGATMGLWSRFPHLWEADHIVPVAEGGGQCGLENYRTACLRCHRAETRRLRQRLAGKRMEERA